MLAVWEMAGGKEKRQNLERKTIVVMGGGAEVKKVKPGAHHFLKVEY